MTNSNKIDALIEQSSRIETPQNYFSGLKPMSLNLVGNLLFFLRNSRQQLHQGRREAPPHHRYVLITNLLTPGTISVDKQLFRLHPGQCILVHPFQFHHFLDIQEISICWIFMTFELGKEGSLEELRNRPLTLTGENLVSLRSVLEAYLKGQAGIFQGESSNMVLLRASLYLEELRLMAFREIVQHVFPRQVADPDIALIQRINKLLFEHELGEVSISILAFNLNLSESHLRTKFRHISGLSLGLYLQNFRIHKALSMIRNSDLSLTQIADQCGYSSLASFSRSFKSVMGSSPGQFRD